MKKSTSYFIFFLFLFILLIILSITIYELRSVFNNLFKGPIKLEQAINEYMSDIGIIRAIVLMILQIATVLLAVLPAEPVQIVAGLSYGIIYGTIICLIGVFLANIIVYLMFKKIGDQVTKFYPNFEKWEKRFILRQNRGGRIVNIIFLYLMPFIPYGVIAYLASRSKLRFIPYITVTTLGAIPSILTSTIITGSVFSGNIIFTFIVIIVVAVFALTTIILKRHYNKKCYQ